ncbi:hypothetical protein FA15DRAFT_761260 [Coprinopsis marcescibilis]|uniref:Uncharacterized protein n=1 Tax=Coprinopsis marcescibilis TaxID=230819 RepID=A0A5C3KB38_COPMA|nr:hypothetical protein FA15DRAFT_761260 [Coprinopsis marcescibilis]
MTQGKEDAELESQMKKKRGGKTATRVINPTRSVMPDVLNATIHGSHLQTAERIDNTYNFYGETDANQVPQLLGNPKGCAWDPSGTCLDGTRLIHIDAILLWATSLEVV